MYKLLTSIITKKIYAHLEANKLLDEEQKGCRQKSRGCKEQLIIDSIIMGDVKRRKSAIHMAYIDYQKAFDSVPHSWLGEILELYRIEDHICKFLMHAMKRWKTNLLLRTKNNIIKAGNIDIRRGIFQGDALSPLWFCMALKPLTTMLNKMGKGVNIGNSREKLSHLWYMDDLKLFATTKQHLKNLLECVGKFSNDIHMKFGLDKCRVNSIDKGKWEEHEGHNVNEWQGMVIGMERNEKYKYLGYLQSIGIDQKIAKETAIKTYMQRVKSILKTELSAGHTAKAVNTYATSVLAYTFGVIKWTRTELEDINTKTRKEFRKYRAHHPHSSIERFHIPRGQGGRGIPDVVERNESQIENLRQYFQHKAQSSHLYTEINKLDVGITPLQLSQAGHTTRQTSDWIQEKKELWKSKPLHGRHEAIIEETTINTEASREWLRQGYLFKETEGFLAAIHDQVIPTKSYRKRIQRENIQNIRCRMCNDKEESLDHIIAGCTTLAPKQYLDRHNRVAKIFHQHLLKLYMKIPITQPYYDYQPNPITEDDHCRIYWNRKIVTDRPIPNNIPDIVITLKEKRQTFIIDIAVPLPTNATKTYNEKISKYLPLADEIKELWNMERVTIIPLVVGATGEIPVKLINNIKKLEMPDTLYISIQKSVILDTCSIVRRVMGDIR